MSYSLDKYIGVPYKHGGRDIYTDNAPLDCWGLVCKMHYELFGNKLPLYSDIETSAGINNEGVVQTQSIMLTSTDLYNQSTPVDLSSIKFGDILIFNIFGYPLHVGFAIDLRTMIHTGQSSASITEQFRSHKWIKRLHQAYRISP